MLIVIWEIHSKEWHFNIDGRNFYLFYLQIMYADYNTEDLCTVNFCYMGQSFTMC
jgi:hypothetical protein